MSADADQPVATGIIGSDNPADGSKLNRLRAAFAEEIAPARLYLEFLARGKGAQRIRVAGEYRVLSQAEVDELPTDNQLARNMQIMIAAHTGVFVYDPEHATKHPDPAQADANDRGLVEIQRWLGTEPLQPMGFDRRLIELLDLKSPPGAAMRDILLELYGGNELMLGQKSNELGAWMRDTEEDGLQDFVSGSAQTPRS